MPIAEDRVEDLPRESPVEPQPRVFGDTSATLTRFPPKKRPANCQPLILDPKLFANANSEHYDLDSLWHEGGCMGVRIKYRGGCGEAEARLAWSGVAKKSMPPQLVFHFIFEKEDNCEALITRDFYFVLDEIRENVGDYVVIRLKDKNATLVAKF